MNVANDCEVEVSLVQTPRVQFYVDLAWLSFPWYALRRVRRSRPGWHIMLAAGFARIYVGVER